MCTESGRFLLDGDDVAEVLLEQRGKVLDLGGRVDGAAGADGDEAVGPRRRLEAGARAPPPACPTRRRQERRSGL